MNQKRIYDSKGRKTKALETRARILEVAKELFQSQGFEGVTFQMLAQNAGVSEPLIYSLFQSKRGILRALMDEALPQGHYESLVEEATQGTDYHKRFKATAKICRQMYEAEQSQMELLRTAAAIAPEFKELEQEREERRYQRQAHSMEVLYKEGGIKKELSLTQARDILWALTGRDLYRLLVIERGWTADAYEIWLAEVLASSLLGLG